MKLRIATILLYLLLIQRQIFIFLILALGLTYKIQSLENDRFVLLHEIFPLISSFLILTTYIALNIITNIRLSGKCLSFTHTSFTTTHLYTNMKPNPSNVVIFSLVEQNGSYVIR